MGGAFNIPRSITDDSNGNVILAGVGGTGFGWQILKCNSNGDSLWSKTLFSFGREARSVITDNEDNIVVTGWVNAIYKYDPDGNLLYNQTLGGDDNWERASLLKYDDENVFVIGGKRRASGSSFDILLGKYSIATGDSIWTYVFNYPEPEFGAYGWDGAILNDSSLVVITQTNTVIGSTFYSNIYLLKFSLADNPVPVELSSFTANISSNSSVVLNWSTATETNNLGFEIERKSVNGDYEKKGFVNGFGTTTEPRTYLFTDNTVSSGIYFYHLKQLDYNGSYQYSDEIEVEISQPKEFSLSQNFPNPFNPTTKIKYWISSDGNVTLTVYNMLGEKVAELVNKVINAGVYEVNFDASKLSSGVYYYRIKTGNYSTVKKMLLMK